MKTKGILTLLILFLIPLTYAVDLINEPFDYSDDYINHDWFFISAFGDFPTAPIMSPFSTYAFGYQIKNPHASGFAGDIYQPISVINGVISLSYDFYLGNNSISSAQPLRAYYYINGSNSNNRILIDINPIGTGLNLSVIYFKAPTATLLCGQNIHNLQANLSGSISIIIDIENELLTAYYNSTAICSGVMANPSSSPFNISRMGFTIQPDGLEYLEAYIDNILLTQTGANTSLSDTGEPCDSSDDCLSGFCEYGQCKLKQVGYPCTSSSQCASGDCHNGLCTKPTLSENVNLALKENFGDDSMTKNIVSMFLMIGIPAGIVIASGGAGLAILLAIVMFITLGFLFTVMGWLSPFITLGIVVVCLIVTVFAFVIGGSSD